MRISDWSSDVCSSDLMASDLLLPGLAAQMLTLPYNPNNVSEDAAPVTVDMEVQAGLQLARMLGYPHDPTRDACAFGHLPRSEESRVGKESVSQCRSRWSQYH